MTRGLCHVQSLCYMHTFTVRIASICNFCSTSAGPLIMVDSMGWSALVAVATATPCSRCIMYMDGAILRTYVSP